MEKQIPDEHIKYASEKESKKDNTSLNDPLTSFFSGNENTLKDAQGKNIKDKNVNTSTNKFVSSNALVCFVIFYNFYLYVYFIL